MRASEVCGRAAGRPALEEPAKVNSRWMDRYSLKIISDGTFIFLACEDDGSLFKKRPWGKYKEYPTQEG
jgi:hypothetical protein